jgi:hypothetical protein
VELKIVNPDVLDFDILWSPICIPLLQCFMMAWDKLDDTTWLMCRLPPLFHYCAHHFQLSQTPFFFNLGWLVSYLMVWDYPLVISCSSYFQKVFILYFKKFTLFVFLSLFYTFMTGISYILEPDTIWHWTSLQIFVTVLLVPIDDAHLDCTAVHIS